MTQTNVVSDHSNNVKIFGIGLLGILIIMTVFTTPAYAAQTVKPTSAGTLNIGFSTDPATPNPGDPTQIKINFINKQTNSTQIHVDYKISVMQGANQVFGIPITHTAEGVVSIPFQFQAAGTYQVIVQVESIYFQPIPPETATFTLDVGTTPSIPEFGPLSGMIIAISTIGVVLLSKRNNLHI